jgi:hypothetical protein
MDEAAAAVIAALRAHEAELRRAGVSSLSLFGSTVRGEADAGSDVDLVVRLREDFAGGGGFAYFGRLEELRERLARILEREVDLIAEPVRKDRLRREIERNRLVAF